MRGSSLGLFIVVLVVFISVAEAGVTECYICGGLSDIDCKSPEKKECEKTNLFGQREAAESVSSPGSSPGSNTPVASPTEAPAGDRKKRDTEWSCSSRYDEDGKANGKACQQPKKDEGCKDPPFGKGKVCYCNSNLCNGSSLPKSISIWGLGLIALLLVLHSSKLL